MRTILSLFLLAVCMPCFAQQKHYTIYFNLDKDSLTPATLKLLSEISASPGNVNIKQINLAGYADKYGTANYNKALSQKRVQAVAQAFNSILPGSTVINTAYYGKDSLLTEKDEEQQLNRRVEITLTYAEPAAHDIPGTKEAPVTKLEPYSEDAALQEFTINLDDTTTVRGDDGTG